MHNPQYYVRTALVLVIFKSMTVCVVPYVCVRAPDDIGPTEQIWIK